MISIGISFEFIDNGDDTPWEITADLLGGVENENKIKISEEQIIKIIELIQYLQID